ncbi:DUF6519 domain-containing protein [Dyella ginsengisoli]|uniref:DUF6519 domain-containing protein n=1 Tax=Dyella ginsengisoli TaxID=363848 RepID=UPI000345EAFA|nr:DUF6519 domain-containing protein [Dyella ginsengisoli]
MATDFSRVRHDPLLDWAGVQLKQGGVLLDADANELVAVLDRRLRALAGDVLGRATVSQTTPDAFKITAAGSDLAIARGRLYVDGLLAENHGGGSAEFDPLMAEPRLADPLTYTTQPHLPDPPALPASGRHLVYLDVWQREVTALEMPAVVEPAVGVDASSRLQTVWQVRVLADEAGDGASCATPDDELPGWSEVIAPSEGRLTTGTYDVPPVDDPCELPPTGGYRGLENQLYRVEIHDPGMPGAGATFKWSRENASVGSRVASYVSATELELDTLGRDDVLGLADGDWVEIVDDVREFAQQPGEMRQIQIPDPGNRRIVFAPALPASMLPAAFPDDTLPATRNLRVRRWDQGGPVFRTTGSGSTTQVQDLDAPGSSGVIDVPAAGTELLLENGVIVSFASIGSHGFRSGDWWVFAARTADATVEQLDAAPPRGIHHHYARLGFWDVAASAVTDCRHGWPPQGGDDCGCTRCVTPESHNSGQLTIQVAVDQLRESGGTICLQTGTYALREPVRIAGARSLSIRGQGPATVLTAEGTAFDIESSTAICVEKLAVLALGKDAAVAVRGVLGLSLRELLVYVFGGNDSNAAAIALSGLCIGARIEDNALLAPDGIRTETGDLKNRAGYALLGGSFIEHNLLYCRDRGIALDGIVAHLWETRVAANQLLGCDTAGIVTPGLALPGSSLHLEANNLEVSGHGIANGMGSCWIDRNRLAGLAQAGRQIPSDGIALVAGLGQAGGAQAHVLANQVGNFSGTGIAIRSPVSELLVKLNTVSGCGAGIVMSEEAESDATSIENNHLRNISGANSNQSDGIAAAIAVTRTAAATVAGNQIHEIARGPTDRLLVAGILISGVTRSRIHGNEVDRVGPAADFTGTVAGVLVRAPMQQTEIANNRIRRDDESQPGKSPWYALLVRETLFLPEQLGNRLMMVNHEAGQSTVRLDARNVLVLDEMATWISEAMLDFTHATAAVARGAVASVLGNALAARGVAPVALVQVGGELMFGDNQCELFGQNAVGSVQLRAPLAVLNANRVRNLGKPSIDLQAGKATVLGNITSADIRLQGQALPAPWNALNLIG